MNLIRLNKSTGWKSAVVATTMLVLTACGGGGGGGDTATPSAVAPAPGVSAPPPSSNSTTISGAVTKGPVAGATLSLFEMDAFGQAIGNAVATGTTTTDGNFSITVPANSGNLLVIAGGGSFIDESDQEPDPALKRRIQLASDETFLSVLPQGQTAVAVTPITTALVVRGRIQGGPDGSFLTKFNASKAILDAQAGFDVVSTIPANPVAPDAAATAAQKEYALLLGGIANLINNVAVQSGASAPTYTMVVAVTFDLIDGQFDGQYFGDVNVPNNTGVPVQLPQNLDLAAEITRFRNNNFENYSDTRLPSIEVTTFTNTPPTANAGADIVVRQNTQGQLDASASSDAETGLFYNWAQTAGTSVALSSPTVAAPTFAAPNRLIGNETLSFTLTVIDSNGIAATDAVDVQVVGGIPSKVYVVNNEQGPGVGEDIDGGGLLTFNLDATGSLLAEGGTETFTYTVAGNTVTLNFSPPLLSDDFDETFDVDGDGNFDDQFLVEEFVDNFQLTLVTDNPNGDAISLLENGTRVFTPISADDTKPSETYQFTEPLTAFDPGQATPFSFADGAQRTLPFNSFSTFSTLFEDDELYLDLFTFNANGTGATVNNNVNFTYIIGADGSLNVTFANGETAKYTKLVTRPTGDVVGTEYTLTAPLVTGDDALIGLVALSIPKNSAATVPTTLAQAAGIYSGTISDDDIPNANLDLRLNPDGTGSINFDSIASNFFLYDFDNPIIFRSNFGVCWNLDANNNIVVNRASSLNVIPGTFSSETTPAFCSALTEADTGFQFNLTQLDSDGTTFKHFDRRLDNCSVNATPPCTGSPVLSVTDFQHRITTRVPLTATPPVAALDAAQTPDATPIVIDILANDIARDLAIDPTSVTLVRGPFFGATSLNAANGQVTYTPNPGITQDVVQYIVRDTAGNPSQVQTVEIVINPCAEINGSRGFFDRFTGDCDYAGVIGLANVATADVNIGPLPMGGVHKFNDSLYIGEDYTTNPALTAAGITQGGDGPSLNIAAGTVLAFSNPSAVVSIRRGSQINVGGVLSSPVVMTSQDNIDSRRAILEGNPGFQPFNATGQWGGVIVHGFGVTNGCQYTGSVSTADLALSGECHLVSDSATGTYGGQNNSDNSGSINYLIIKHAGGTVNSDTVGGLGLFAVGSGTSLAKVEAYATAGDGLQLIGGAASVTDYVGLYNFDAAVGIDEGYSGNMNRLLLVQDENSGNQCINANGIVDASLLSSPQIEAIITQGINSRPFINRVTCVISGVGGQGQGFKFADGAFTRMQDAIVTVPGPDSNNMINYCVAAEGRTLQGVVDGELNLRSSIFACPDRTNGAVLPNSQPLETVLASPGGLANQFATLTPGIVNPVPVAGTSNVLLEGSPLIYAVPQANLRVDGSPTTVTPTSAHLGAVVQTDDWTLNWTFGLHPGVRQVPLWYERPIVVAPGLLKQSKGQTVTLDASQSVAASGPVTYQWAQTNGAPVTLSDPAAAAPTFIAPGVGTNLTAPGGVFEFSVIGTDANGFQSQRQVRVEVDASIPAEFYTVFESIIPFQFNRTIEGGNRVSVRPDNTGTYIGDQTIEFTWTDTPTTFTMDFSGAGGLVFDPVISFLDVSPSPGQEQVTITGRLDSRTLTLVSDNGPKKVFSTTESGVNTRFNDTDSVALPDDVFTDELVNSRNAAIVSVQDGLNVCCAGDTTSLPVNVSTTVTSLLNPGFLTSDQLTFNADGTGFARLKSQSFNYSSNGRQLDVIFSDGEAAEYTFLFNSPSGDAVGVQYTKLDSSVITDVSASVDDNPAANWVLANVPGIYTTNKREELDDGTFVDSKLFYRLHPEGTGQLELESVNLANGNIEAIFTSSRGICWQLDGNGDLIIARTTSPDQRFAGSRVPSLSTCSLLNTAAPDYSLVAFTRTNKLEDINASGQLLTFVEDNFNQCNANPVPPGCDATQIELRGTFQRIFDPVVPFLGNPPLAVPDSTSASGGLLVGTPVLSNDLPGDSAIVPTSVTIVLGPFNGTATVDGPTGDILYTSNGGFTGTDTIYYRVQDANGNLSTVGTLTINVL
jgi:hypothetical protein